MHVTRCFVAVPLLPPALAVARRLLDQLSSQLKHVRWTRPDQLHVTVKFLGDIDNRELPEVCRELRSACATIEPFTTGLRGLGTFPKDKPPRVLWAKVEPHSQPLVQLYERLEANLQTLGIPQEARAYTPHLTLGRVGRGADVDQVRATVESLAAEVESVFDVNEVILFSSFRERGNVIHEPIDTVEL